MFRTFDNNGDPIEGGIDSVQYVNGRSEDVPVRVNAEAIRIALKMGADPYDIIHDLINQHAYASTVKFPSVVRGTHEYNEKVTAWRAEEVRLNALFLADMAQAYGFENHPKGPAVAQFAWQEGHSNGLTEVLHWYHKLVELLS